MSSASRTALQQRFHLPSGILCRCSVHWSCKNVKLVRPCAIREDIRGGMVYRNSFLAPALNGMGRQLDAPAALGINRTLSGPQSRYGRFGGDKKPCLCSESTHDSEDIQPIFQTLKRLCHPLPHHCNVCNHFNFRLSPNGLSSFSKPLVCALTTFLNPSVHFHTAE